MECLNCNSEASGVYCQNCGQKTRTTRFSFKHIFKNDIADPFFSIVNSPLFFSLKELVTRPGDSIREYIEGKRMSHMNYMSMFLLLSGVGLFLDKYITNPSVMLAGTNEQTKSFLKKYFEFIDDNPKAFIFITIPIISLFTFMFFKKSKYFFSEHLIMNVYKASALLVLTKGVAVFTIFSSNLVFLEVINQMISISTLAYSFWFLHQFFYDRTLYNKIEIFTKTGLAIILGTFFSSLTIFIYWIVNIGLKNGI
jgi:hypothetical protein